ncbi:MAG: hypothetical protein IT381_15850 [Deltaproteobacteria bacterium]|nr:hypothetical protein [Deltaproteobacteria bacterium]
MKLFASFVLVLACCQPAADAPQGFLDSPLADELRALPVVKVFAWPAVLAQGTVIDAGFADGEPPIVVDGSARFYFVDLAPGAMWNHPTLFVVVDAATGAEHVTARDSYPTIDGHHVMFNEHYQAGMLALETAPVPKGPARSAPPPTPLSEGIPTADDPRYKDFKALENEGERYRLQRFQAFHEEQQPASEVAAALGECPMPATCAQNSKRLALLVDGGDTDRKQQDLVPALTKLGYATRVLDSTAPDSAAADAAVQPTTMPRLEAAFAWLAANATSCCDRVYIYMHAHGSATGSMSINEDRPAMEGDGRVDFIGHKEGGTLLAPRFKELLNTIKSCQIKVIIWSCYAGKHLERGLNELPEPAQGCHCQTVIASSSARQVTWAHPDEFVNVLKENPEDLATAMTQLVKYRIADDAYTEGAYHNTPRVQSTSCEYCKDPDGDGVLTGIELINAQSDPNNADTDGDNIGDAVELAHGWNPKEKDSDSDGLDDDVEIRGGTDPGNADSDGDGLDDKREKLGGSDPHDKDSDDDGLEDGPEVDMYHSSPVHKDSDGDGLQDPDEVAHGTNPNMPDTDHDGISDKGEVDNGWNPLDPLDPG